MGFIKVRGCFCGSEDPLIGGSTQVDLLIGGAGRPCSAARRAGLIKSMVFAVPLFYSAATQAGSCLSVLLLYPRSSQAAQSGWRLGN